MNKFVSDPSIGPYIINLILSSSPNHQIIVSCALLAVVAASPIGGYQHQQHEYHHQQESADKHAVITQTNDQRGKDGSYGFNYETSNGISAHEQGYTKNAGHKEHETQVAEGYYSYIGQDGKKITVHYSADENGFRAQGDHLPTPPPVPKEILESLAKNAAEEAHGHYEHAQPQYHQAQPQYHQHY